MEGVNSKMEQKPKMEAYKALLTLFKCPRTCFSCGQRLGHHFPLTIVNRAFEGTEDDAQDIELKVYSNVTVNPMYSSGRALLESDDKGYISMSKFDHRL